jgi:superfamily I DNA/RNA helicase
MERIPTKEQQEIINFAKTGQSFVVEALAGTGKTTTIEMIAKDNPDKNYLYIVFNKSQQKEAKARMPKNVEPRTIDSLSYEFAVDRYKSMGRVLQDRMYASTSGYLKTNKDIAYFLNIDSPKTLVYVEPKKISGEDGDGEEIKDKIFSVSACVSYVKDAVNTFCISEDTRISEKHFDKEFFVDLWAVEAAEILWKDLSMIGGKVKITHSHIMKLWSLKNPTISISSKGIKFDGIFIDEAQDTNPVANKIYSQQTCQMIYVGDTNQSIYKFRGSINALEHLGYIERLPLTESWRFGEHIADIANEFIRRKGSEQKVIGLGKAKGEIVRSGSMGADADTLICRTNAGMLRALLEFLDSNIPVWLPKTEVDDLILLLESIAYFKNILNYTPIQIHEDIQKYSDAKELMEAINEGEESKKISEIYELLNTRKFEDLKELISTVNARSKKGVQLITAHRSKGSEWDNVQIYEDFWGYRPDRKNKDIIPPSPDELMLAYVAVTRAKVNLDLGSLDYILKSEQEIYDNFYK